MPNTLTECFCRKAKPRAGQRFTYYGDLYGLRLRVTAAGAKAWTQRLTILGKRRDLGLGSYPEVTLEEARELALENRRTARKGGNPVANLITFREAADQTLALDAPSWRSERMRADIARLLERYAMPTLGRLRPAEVRSRHIMEVLLPIWTKQPAQAARLLQRLGRIFDYCQALELCDSNPAKAAIIKAALPKPAKTDGNGNGKHEHHKALPHGAVAGALAKVDGSNAMQVVKALVRFTALTAVRIGEARGAEWAEIDLEAKVWTIPASRMKGNREHRVPLSAAACDVLRQQAEARPANCAYVFANKRGKTLSEGTARALFSSLKIGTVHGLRSAFRDWGGERTDAPREVLERCLAHATGTATEQAYARTDLLEKRRAVMDAWAEYLSR